MTAADPGSMLAAGEARREASPADGWPDSMPTAGAGSTANAGRAVAVSAALAELTAEVARSVVVVRGGPGSSGSGVVWDQPRVVITNHHVVPGPQAQVVLPDGRRLPARVTRRAPALDLVALELDTDLPGAARVGDSDRLRPGDLVLAVGNPMAERNASTLGIVGALPAEHLQVAIDLRPGNSGGALANARGEVVGIPHMVTGAGLALAVPSATVARFLGGDAEPLRWL
jgi:serine protease Do